MHVFITRTTTRPAPDIKYIKKTSSLECYCCCGKLTVFIGMMRKMGKTFFLDGSERKKAEAFVRSFILFLSLSKFFFVVFVQSKSRGHGQGTGQREKSWLLWIYCWEYLWKSFIHIHGRLVVFSFCFIFPGDQPACLWNSIFKVFSLSSS